MLQPPGRSHQYRIVERVAAGGEGTTFRAELLVAPGSHAVPVAVKQYLRPPGASGAWPHDGTWQSLTEQEAFLDGLPKNDHLVWIREVFLGHSGEPPQPGDNRRPDVPFVVMEWVDGQPPDALIDGPDGGLLRRIDYIDDLAEAVAVLHSDTQHNPLTHADIKPGNCVLTADRGLVLLDLGGLHLVGGRTSGQGLFTEPFAAPEVLADPGQPRGPASDVYSLAATAFWFVTGQEPPNPDHPGYLAEAEEMLRGCRLLRRPISRRPRRRLVRHLLAGIGDDAVTRGAIDPRRWSRRLRRLARRPRLRRRFTSGTAVLLVIAYALAWAGLLPFVAPDPIDERQHIVHWKLLPSDASAATRRTYAVDFTRGTAGWRLADATLATATDGPRGLEVAMLQNRQPAALAAPVVSGAGQEVVEARARLVSGQGAWGVWCRGTSVAGTTRYRFLLTHAGAVGIFAYRAGGRPAPAEDGSGWWYLDGVDLAGPVTMTASCRDAPTGGQVDLRLAINGRTVTGYRPPAGFVLSPGYSGIEAYSFSDVAGPKLDAVFTSFTSSTAISQE